MRLVIRCCLSAIAGAALCALPVLAGQGAHGRVLGNVAQADRAHLGGAAAFAGADVYGCDALETDEGGALRVQVGASQIYLSALSSTELEAESNEIRAHVIRGTLAFSIPAASNFALETPAGVLRAENGQSVAGQVTVTGPHEMVISASRGDLLLDTWGEFRSIPEGKSARINFGSTLEVSCSNKGGGEEPHRVPHAYAQNRIEFHLIVGTVVGVSSYFIWQELTESPSKP